MDDAGFQRFERPRKRGRPLTYEEKWLVQHVFETFAKKKKEGGIIRIEEEDPYSTVVFWPVRDECSSRHDRLLLGEQIAKDIFHPLPKLEMLVRI